MPTRTIKLVVVGDSGVGKTSLRSQYISDRYSTGYRATIGADFITKTLPHPHRSDESITLQIWDTAGQERFSSLSAAFFRGADAVLLMFDASRATTLPSLEKWWNEFRTHAPVSDKDVSEFCTVVVGNKMDLLDRRTPLDGSDEDVSPSPLTEECVSQADAQAFINKIVPLPLRSLTPQDRDPHPSQSPPSRPRTPSVRGTLHRSHPSFTSNHPPSPSHSSYHTAARSIAIFPNAKGIGKPRGLGHSRSRSRSRSQHFAAGTAGTMGTMTTTTFSIYHTPSSSLYEDYASARSTFFASPSRLTRTSASTTDLSSAVSPESLHMSSAARPVIRRMASVTMFANSDAPTVRPRTLARSRSPAASLSLSHLPESLLSSAFPPDDTSSSRSGIPELPPHPEQGARLFFTSAKTGSGVADVFVHVAARVVRKWEFEEAVEARQMSVWDAPHGTSVLRLGEEREGWGGRVGGQCCAI